jgi:hypothetical protein
MDVGVSTVGLEMEVGGCVPIWGTLVGSGAINRGRISEVGVKCTVCSEKDKFGIREKPRIIAMTAPPMMIPITNRIM